MVREFELVRGKAHKGKKGWIVRFDGVDSLDDVCLFCTPAESLVLSESMCLNYSYLVLMFVFWNEHSYIRRESRCDMSCSMGSF